MNIEKVRQLESFGPGQVRTLVRVTFSDGAVQHYCASSIPRAFDTGKPETLMFECDENGEQSNYRDVAGGMHMSTDEAIEDLRQILAEEKTRTFMDTPMMVNAGGDPIAAILNTLTGFAGLYGSDDEDDE